MKLTLLGVMGSVPGGQSDLGKNTTSLLIESNNNSILIDSGTGIINYFDQSKDNNHYILFTHYHLDHIIGLPFIQQLYQSDQTFHMYGPQLHAHNTSTILPTFLKEPFFPIDVSDVASTITHQTLKEKTAYTINQFKVNTMLVDHPGNCMVYSILCNGGKITVLTDFPNESHNWNEIIKFSANSDIIYIDGYLMKKEMEHLNLYGHCTIEKAIDLFQLSNSKKLILSHHKNNRMYNEIKDYESDNITIAIENQVYSI